MHAELLTSNQRRVVDVSSLPSYRLLVLVVICFVATVWFTWPLWQVRTAPPLLPVVDLPQFSFGWMLIAGSIFALIKPRVGVFLLGFLLLVAMVFDQTRTQPQFFAMWMLMLPCVTKIGLTIVRWFLVALWLWSGVHKLLSPEWFGPRSWGMLVRAGLPLAEIQWWLALAVAVGEMALGLAAIYRPKTAAMLGVLLHWGIILALSPLVTAWNYSVIPWNFATAVVGYWVLNQASLTEPHWGRRDIYWAALWLVTPLGFYTGWLDHGFSHVLYSGMIPSGAITNKEGVTTVEGWGDLRVPFPCERRLLLAYFEATAQPGDKMHLKDPRLLLDDCFYSMDAHGKVHTLTQEEFLKQDGGAIAGTLHDDMLDVWQLVMSGARLVKRHPLAMVHAIEFKPEQFSDEQILLLAGLPNLEQIQFAGTTLRDDQLARLPDLPRLQMLGLDRTKVTDAGLKHLAKFPALDVVQVEGTAVTDAGLLILAELLNDSSEDQ